MIKEKRLDDNSPTVNFWITVRTFLKCYFSFILGQRTGDWIPIRDSIDDLIFALDRSIYARFTQVFPRDMACSPELHPNVHAAFTKDLFLVQRSKTKFSLIGLHQRFLRDINVLIKTVANHFMKNDPELITLTHGEIMDPGIATSLRHAPEKVVSYICQ